MLGALLLLLALTAPAIARPSQPLAGASTLSGQAVVISVTKEGNKHETLLGVETADGRRIHVALAGQQVPHTLSSGTHIQLAGQWQQPQAATSGGAAATASQTTRFIAAAIRAAPKRHPVPQLISEVGAAGGASAANGAAAAGVLSRNEPATRNLNTLFVPIVGMSGPRDACPGSELPWYAVEDVERAVFADASPRAVTVGSTYARCSHGKTQLTRKNSLVAPLVRLPCKGISNGIPWTFSKCEFEDFTGYADAADAALRRQGVDVDRYKYRVYLLPPGACSIVGMGMVGCGDSCRSWIGAGYWIQPNAMVHELGHNLFLGHAGAYTEDGVYDEYRDSTGMMGYCCQDRCPNTVHAWQLGWLSVRQLNATTLRAGRTISLMLPSQSRSSLAGLRVLTSWAPGADPLFVGYRTRTGGDTASPEEVAGKVHIYSSPIADALDSRDSTYYGALGAGQAYVYRAAGVVVRVKTVAAAAATISICRRAGRETLFSCRNSLDYDCNGLVGAADPGCARLFKRAAIPA